MGSRTVVAIAIGSLDELRYLVKAVRKVPDVYIIAAVVVVGGNSSRIGGLLRTLGKRATLEEMVSLLTGF